jgi:hypothetical protein
MKSKRKFKGTPGIWPLPHFVRKEKDGDCICGFILPECMHCVGNLFVKQEDLDGIPRGIDDSENPPLEEAIANAHLICNSPKLLNAAQDMLLSIERERYSSPEIAKAYTKLGKIINKCLGGE